MSIQHPDIFISHQNPLTTDMNFLIPCINNYCIEAGLRIHNTRCILMKPDAIFHVLRLDAYKCKRGDMQEDNFDIYQLIISNLSAN